MPRLEATEKEIQHGILDYLRMKGIFVWRNNTGAFKVGDRFIRTGMKGLPDILGVLQGGKLLAIEVKRESGRVSPEQEEVLLRLKNAGAVAFVARSLDDVISNLLRHGN